MTIADISDLTAAWDVPQAAVGVSTPTETIGVGGDTDWVTPLASITKLFTSLAALIAVEEGTLSLDSSAGPPGSTVRHLLAHTAGYGFDDPTLMAAPGDRRIYSNVGMEVLASHLEGQAGMPFGDYLQAAVFDPLGMSSTLLSGSPAHGASSSVEDLLRFARELMAPTLIHPSTLEDATVEQFRGLVGVLPGFGRQDPNPWGLGFEVRGEKHPHWTGSTNAPETFGHFGGAGTFLWVDPTRALACCCVTNRAYGPWANEVWPALSDAVIERFS